VSRYRKGKTNLDFTEARDSEWQWHQLGHMQVCTSLQTDNHANTPPLSFLQAGCPSCRPTNSVKAPVNGPHIISYYRGSLPFCVVPFSTYGYLFVTILEGHVIWNTLLWYFGMHILVHFYTLLLLIYILH